MKFDKKILGVLILCLVVFALFLKPKKENPPIETLSSSSSTTSQALKGADPVELKTNTVSGMTPEQLKKWVAKDEVYRKLEMKQFIPLKEGNQTVLNVEVRVKKGCFPGDMDAIEMDLKAAPSYQLLGTLEGMNSGVPSFSWNIPKDFFSTGVSKNTFKLKASDRPVQLGFYLCTSKGGGTCQGKKVRDINEIFTEHLNEKGNVVQEERVIFFQYFLLDDEGLRVFQGHPKGKETFDELKKLGQDFNFQGTGIPEGIDRAQEALEKIVSLPIVFEKDKLIIELPKYDADVCASFERKGKEAEKRKK